MSRSMVVFLPGPHAPGHNGTWDPAHIRLHRIDAAIAEARRLHAPLIVAGDGWQGKDIGFFLGYAYEQVCAAIPAFDIRGGTLHDVQAAFEVLGDGLWGDIEEVRFVSDPEHLPRVLEFARGEAPRILSPHRKLEFVPVPALGGPEWTELERQGELCGIAAYRAGTYGTPYPGLEALGKLPPERRLGASV